MKKIVAFLMAFALCIVCFGTYGFADLDCHDESHDHGHNHVVKAVDDDLDNYRIPEAARIFVY